MTDIENLTGFKAMNTPNLSQKDKSIILFNILSNFQTEKHKHLSAGADVDDSFSISIADILKNFDDE